MHRFIIWTYCASGQTDGSWHKGTDLNRVEHYNGLLLHINAENQRVCCAVESTYMLNVEGHLTMSSKGMLGGGGKTRKWGYSKSESVIGPVSSFHCNKMQRKWFLNSFFFAHFVIVDFFPCYIPTAGIIVLARGCNCSHETKDTESFFTSWHYKSFIIARQKKMKRHRQKYKTIIDQIVQYRAWHLVKTIHQTVQN